jgi:hypothetical protein
MSPGTVVLDPGPALQIGFSGVDGGQFYAYRLTGGGETPAIQNFTSWGSTFGDASNCGLTVSTSEDLLAEGVDPDTLPGPMRLHVFYLIADAM